MEKGTALYFGKDTSETKSLKTLLEKDGFSLKFSDDIEDAPGMALREKPFAILIDIDTFGEDAWAVCAELKDDLVTRKAALILLTDTDDENLIIKGLEKGADDVMELPLRPREVAAKMKTLARRIVLADNKKIRVKDIEIDLDEHRVRKAGKPIELTYIQFKLLYLLASRRNNVFSRKEILEKVWGKKVYVTNRTVDVHIKRLREKLGEYKYPSQYIETIHGTGYRFL